MTLKWKRANNTETTNEWKYSDLIGLSNGYKLNARGFWLVKRTLGWKNFMPENFLETNRYLTLTSRCNTIGQSMRPCFDLFIHWLIKQISNTYRNLFSRSYENRSSLHLPKSSGKSYWKVINGTRLFGSFQRNVWKGSPVFPDGTFQSENSVPFL